MILVEQVGKDELGAGVVGHAGTFAAAPEGCLAPLYSQSPMAMNDPIPPSLRQALAQSQQLASQFDAWYVRNLAQIQRAIDAVSEPVRKASAFIEANRGPIEAALRTLQQLQDAGDATKQEWQQAGLGYLVAPLALSDHLFLSAYAEPGDPEQLFDFFEAALADPDFVEGTCTALDTATVLSDVPRDHLKHGLRHLGQREPQDAWPPLIIGLEGAFADVAVAQGVAVRSGNDVYFADANAKPVKKPGGVEDVAKKLGHAAGGSDFGEFLIRKVYGGEGNPFRHGTARDGVRERSICLAVAVVGWLDAFVAPGSESLLADAVQAEIARRWDEEHDTQDAA